jgi:AcrR family transcriptional regulator
MPRKPAVPGIDRRQQILEAALSVFAEQGFEAATNREITERAGVNQGLIYFYFESKADVFFATFEYHAQLVLAQLDTVFEQEGDKEAEIGLAHLLKGIVVVLDTPHAINLLRIMHQVMGSQTPNGALSNQEARRSITHLAGHLVKRLREYLEAQVTQGRLRPVKTGLTAYLMTSMLIASVSARRQGQAMQVSSQELAEGIVPLLCYGLLPRDESPDLH